METEKSAVYEQDLGMETYAEVREMPNKKYQVFVTPLYGGDFFQYGDEHETIEEAKKFINSIT